MRVLIFGLGLHGGGVSAALYFISHGHEVRVTDLKSSQQLSSSLDALKGYNIKYCLEEHRIEDVRWADIIIKNPAVPAFLPLLKENGKVFNDIGYFLSHTRSPIIGVTGSKGKSTTTSLISHLLRQNGLTTFVGGNIGVSPLNFIDELCSTDSIVLELSSWQIHDLAVHPFRGFQDIIMTPLYHDHQNRYKSFKDYLDDKFSIFQGEQHTRLAILPLSQKDNGYSVRAKKTFYYTFEDNLPDDCDGVCMFNKTLRVSKEGNIIYEAQYCADLSFIPALTYAFASDISPDLIEASIKTYEGLPHRREIVFTNKITTFINDSAATIPDAVAFSISQLEGPINLITGGTDKELDPTICIDSIKTCHSVHLLSGSYTEKLIPLLKKNSISFFGPFDSMKEVVFSTKSEMVPGSVILLSPGASSFEFFDHEFARGDAFKEAVKEIFKEINP